jgi:hypothetical protein
VDTIQARRSTGCARCFACHAVQRSASRVSESSARLQVPIKRLYFKTEELDE